MSERSSTDSNITLEDVDYSKIASSRNHFKNNVASPDLEKNAVSNPNDTSSWQPQPQTKLHPENLNVETHASTEHASIKSERNGENVSMLSTKEPRDWKSWYFYHLPERFYPRLFMGVSILSALVVLSLQIYICVLYFTHFTEVKEGGNLKQKAVATYVTLFCIAEIYQMIITWTAIKDKSRIQVFLLLSFLSCMIIYSGIQFIELKYSLSPYLEADKKSSSQGSIIAIICLLLATFLGQAYIFAFHLRKEFAWDAFKKIGASPEAIKRLYCFHIYRALLYFDGFFFPAFTIQFLIMMPKVSKVEMTLTSIVIPLSIILLLYADFCASNEKKSGTYCCLFVYLLGMVYSFFKIIRIYTHNTDPHEYFPGRRSLTTFAVFVIILLLLTSLFCILTLRNYNKGLKPYIEKKWLKRWGSGAYDPEAALALKGKHDQRDSMNYRNSNSYNPATPHLVVT